MWTAIFGMAGDFQLGDTSWRRSGRTKLRKTGAGIVEITSACVGAAGRSFASGSMTWNVIRRGSLRASRFCLIKKTHEAGLAFPTNASSLV